MDLEHEHFFKTVPSASHQSALLSNRTCSSLAKRRSGLSATPARGLRQSQPARRPVGRESRSSTGPCSPDLLPFGLRQARRSPAECDQAIPADRVHYIKV